jgi:hypothetical protein
MGRKRLRGIQISAIKIQHKIVTPKREGVLAKTSQINERCDSQEHGIFTEAERFVRYHCVVIGRYRCGFRFVDNKVEEG